MGLFSKSNDKPEYEEKPYEWFLSEEGKLSYLKYAKNWEDMDAFLVNRDAWNGGFEEVAKISSCPNVFKPIGMQKTWPCHFFANFIKACEKKYNKDKEHPQLHSSLSRFISMNQETGVLLYYLSLMIPDDLNDLKWPDFLTPEGNPFIYYIYHSNYHLPSDLVVISLVYIHEMIQQNIDVSKEAWMYDDETYFDNRWEGRYREDNEMREIAIKSSKYPDVLREIIYG